MHHLHCKSEEPAGKRHSFLSRERQGRRERMRNTYWFAVDYNGTGHLFACPPERDTGMWTGEEALYIPKGQFGEMFPRITWQDVPVVVTLEVLPCVETRRLRLVKRCLHLLRRHTGRNQSKDMEDSQ